MPPFTAYVVAAEERGRFAGALATRDLEDLGSDGILVRVQYSSLNYKDALVARGLGAIVKTWPHVPGIDAAGTVVGSDRDAEKVLVTGFGLGTEVWGGFGDYIRVPPAWLVPLPLGLTAQESMILGTAGFTAGLALDALLRHGIDVKKGEVLVTGATGGVGSIAVMLLAQLGFEVVASTRKRSEEAYLQALGAKGIVEGGVSEDARPLHKGRWQAVIDTVGGPVLAQTLKSVAYGGAVATCGMVAGSVFQSSVFPFILRGVSLLGIDSVLCPMATRLAIWARLASVWKPQDFGLLHQSIARQDLNAAIQALLEGRHRRRTLVCIDEG